MPRSLWKQATSPRKARGAPPPPATAAELAAAFRQCCAALWPVLGAQAVAPPGAANDAAGRNERRGAVRRFLQQHPGRMRLGGCTGGRRGASPAGGTTQAKVLTGGLT